MKRHTLPFSKDIIRSLTPTPRSETPNIPEAMIIDSHIHLYPESEQETLSWLTGPDHPLYGQHSVEDYLAVTRGSNRHGQPDVRGFVFLEVDRKVDMEKEDFEEPLQEISFLARIQQALPREGEGHTAEHAKLVLGIVPWAPIPLGPEKLASYVDAAKKAAGSSASRICGFRYLIQDKPLGTCISQPFIESLKWLGRNNYAFDVGIDMATESRQGREAISMIEAAHEGVPTEEKVTMIINHIIKPDISQRHLTRPSLLATESFAIWQKAIWELSSFEKTYMKLSGVLAQFGKGSLEDKERTPEELYELIEPWLTEVLQAFGPRRIMWGSDWPVCEVSPCGKKAWGAWREVCLAFMEDNQLSESYREMIWSATAVEAYCLTLEG